ncbi:hypothetical protein CAPTEDRAFT_225969 [Capitella teleta]|uniref:Exonuclease domain-containing protein n=1 Tax=Capitella teleta TaxID=283909 RepID=R7TWJ6_CAPTE|nr:hypothetical protein CAPTEDRAFT_225969 [Capitella teleta]|eukprot:ELT98134.1 hypothetical protein CAPTEDRAFT_225969 [Capitella teleta]
MADISGSGAEPIFKEQNFDYFLVLDFEATCDDKVQVDPQEIIEFPVLKVNAKTFEVESTFHQYVEPRVHKQLSPFCVELTGIIQDMVDGQQHLEAVLGDFQKWMQDEGLLNEGVKFIFVTCGDWDLKKMLPSQAKYFDIAYPDHMKSWINIKRPFTDVVGQYPKNDMMEMLQKLNIAHTGRHHSGIDDCKNIAKILRGIALKGYCFRCTLSL